MTSLRAATRRLLDRLRDDSVDVDAEYVVAPTSIEEAAGILGAAAEAGIPTTFWGSGSHRGYGNPVAAGLVMTSSRLDAIVDWQPDDLTVVVQAGVPIGALEAEIGQRAQTAVFPEDMPGCTVGSVVAMGASGYRRLRYGPTRDRVLKIRLASGYGEVVMGGSPVVKSSTGYGLPRLVTGSLGSLGMIGEVTLKLWAQPMTVATVEVDDAAAALRSLYRPLAVLETPEGSFVYLGGPEAQIADESGHLGAVAHPGLAWPEPISDPIRLEFRVPAPHLETAIQWMRRLEAPRWIAHHGVGIVSGGFEDFNPEGFSAARDWAESVAGALVVTAGGSEFFDPWGTPPTSIEIQQRIKHAFDPAGICNPGILGSGL